MILLQTLNFWVALGAVAMQVASVALIIVFFFRKSAWARPLAALVSSWGLWLSFLVALAGTVLSLVYSDYFGIIPCGLCWLQRVFLYPQVVLLGIAAWKKDVRIAVYSIALSALGGIVALYQHYLQMGGHEAIPCPASGVGDCAKRYIYEFDYVTFPLVAASAFLFLIVIMFFVRAGRRSAF